jgi:Predicted nucleotidyltransferases
MDAPFGRRSSLRNKLLGYLFSNERAESYVRELARTLDVDATNLSRELTNLERQGIVLSKIRGRQKYFRLNRGFPLYKELRRIVQAHVGAAEQLRHALDPLETVTEAYLFGSFAKNEVDSLSDLDVLIVGDAKTGELEMALRPLEKRLGKQINFTSLSRQELAKRLRAKDAFLSDVWFGPKIKLIGPRR